MSKENFLSQNNVNLIWEVLIEDVLKNRPKEVLQQIHEKINQIMSPFYENEKHLTNNLMDLNKKFMAIIINYVNKNFDTQESIFLQQQKISTPTQPKTNKLIPITFEELHSQRINEFDQKLSKMQDDFTNAITMQVPEMPNFKDKVDEPINEIEMEVKKMMAQRNYDIEQITKNFSPKENVDNLLKPVDTSIKNEKLTNQPNYQQNQPNYQQNQPKLIKINENEIINNAFRKNEIIDLNTTPQKRISWEDEKIANESSDNNIFKKFKLVPEMLKENDNNNNYNDNDLRLKYVEVEIQQMNFKIEEIHGKINEIFNILKKNK
jgi:hypothetical protein